MMRKVMVILAVLVAVSTAYCGDIRFVDTWDFQGIPAYGETRAPLVSAEVPEFLDAQKARQATFEFGRGDQSSVIDAILCTLADGTKTLYVDCDANGRIVPGEKARVAKPIQRPPDFGEEDETVWIAPILEPFERLAAFRVAGFGRMLACAIRGYGRADIPDGDATVPVIFIDATPNMFLRIHNDEMFIARSVEDDVERIPVAARFNVGETPVSLPTVQPMNAAMWEPAPEGIVPTTFTIKSLKGKPLKMLATIADASGEVFRIEKLNEPIDLPAGKYSAESLMLIVGGKDSTTTYTLSRMGTVPPVEISGDSAEFELVGDVNLSIYVDGELSPGGRLSIRVNPRTATSLDLNSMNEGAEVCSSGGCCGSTTLTGGVALLNPEGVKLVRRDGLRASCCGTFARTELTVPPDAKPGEYTIRAMLDCGLLGVVAIDTATVTIEE